MSQVMIFDLDGTLLDSADMWQKIDTEFLEKRGLSLPEDYGRAVSLMHLMEAAEYTIARFSLAETPEMVAAEWREMAYEAYASRVPMKEGAWQFLAAQRQSGVRMAVATALDRPLAEAALVNHGIADWFEVVVCAADVGQGKSSPAIFLEAAARLGVSPIHCTVFEDTLGGVRSAKAAGMRVVAVEDDGSAPDREAIRQTADEYWVGF